MAKANVLFKSTYLNFYKNVELTLSEELENYLWCLGMKQLPYLELFKKAHRYNIELATEGDILWLADEKYSGEISYMASLLQEDETYHKTYLELNNSRITKKMTKEYKRELLEGIGIS